MPNDAGHDERIALVFQHLPEVPSFDLRSDTISPWQALSLPQMSGKYGVTGGQDISPQLSWDGAPPSTKSFAVTVFDPDAATLSGFWHWAVANIPATVRSLPTGAGDPRGTGLPPGSIQLRGDTGDAHFIGAAPAVGSGVHRYVITVHALNVDRIELPDGASPGYLGFNMAANTVGRATLVATASL